MNDQVVMWQERLADWKESGLPKKTWCRENNVTINKFRYWHDKLLPQIENETDSSKVADDWVVLNEGEDSVTTSSDSTLEKTSDIITITMGNIKIDVKKGFDSELLTDVLKVLNNV